MTATEQLLDRRGSLPVRLRVHEPDRDTRYVRVDGRLVVGSSELADLCLTDPRVSRHHLTVSPAPGGVRVRDEGSRNGTWLRETRVLEAELAVGDEIRVGTTSLRVELDRFAEPPPAPEAIRDGVGRFRGRAAVLQPLYRRLERAASFDTTILLEGESGTGKELLAEAIHELSPRASCPFVVVDCAAIAETLAESQLFGHERGAFTGAHARAIGAFEAAANGTVFLDEIGELSPGLQSRLLGVLERRSLTRVGGTERIEVRARVVAATHRNLEREVEAGRFRLDLYHRLAVARLRVPPLSERAQDIPFLAQHFAGRALEPSTIEGLCARAWPGNVRELRNSVERLTVFGEQDISAPSPPVGDAPGANVTEADAWLLRVAEAARSGLPFRLARERAMALFSEEYAADMLRRAQGNVTRAAAAAGIARRYFYRVKGGLSG